MKSRIGLFAGDPSGIGPEITGKLLALSEIHLTAEVGIVGGRAPKARAGFVSAEAGAYCLDALRDAARLLAAGELDAFCYGPLNKQALKAAGMRTEDEMRFLAAETGHAGPLGEINAGPEFWTSRVTSHVPVSEIARRIDGPGIAAAARLLHGALSRTGLANPRIAVAALNPHAGDGGTLGREEIDVIAPAIQTLKDEGIGASGPHPADTVFLAARKGQFDGVVTMYHDPGQIAITLLGFDRGVTIHGGLPWPVTTPAHGTAFDIVGKGIASHSAFREAFLLAARMAESRNPDEANRVMYDEKISRT